MLHKKCPCCDNEEIEPFFSIKSAPIFSLVTVSSKEEALAVPKKDIELGFCHNCGFIFNRLYDTNVDYFSMGYEDQQGFSKTFMEFLTRISNDLIKKYDLKDKTLLEIGCGKGDFINLLNELAGGKGIGIDPAYVDGRQTNPNLSFHKELYSEKHGELAPDFICCRHTLEHIFYTRKFLDTLRKSHGNSKPVIFIEIPQINRILDDQVFWDIYYEHCSYFSPGSLGRLLRNTGYEIRDLKLDYGDQYLLAEAVPSENPKVISDIEESLEEQKTRVKSFAQKTAASLDNWRTRLTKMKNSGSKVVVWGGGSKSVGFLTMFSDLNLIEYVVDINPNMENNYIPGIGAQYVQPKFLEKYQPDVVIIMNGIYQKEISASMSEMGVTPEIFAL